MIRTMGETTEISWTDHTFNPWIGCTNVSPACDNCYAEKLVHRYGWAKWGAGEPRKVTSDANWRKPLAWDRKAKRDGVRRRVFCASLADVFDAEVPDDWRDNLTSLIQDTPNLDWLLLTKRPNVALKYWKRQGSVPGNVWMGTTVENQSMADLRIPALLQIPARVRFLSCEPLLGPVNLRSVAWHGTTVQVLIGDPKLSWIIAGGESGPRARPSHPDWFRQLRDQCQAAGVAFHHKQNGEWSEYGGGNGWRRTSAPDALPQRGQVFDQSNFCDGLALFDGQSFETAWPFPQHPSPGPCMVKVGKAKSGAMLDGREWREFPTQEHPQ